MERRPEQLSSKFVKLLYDIQGIHTGYFQIVEFHQKKNKYYSTHISDGYYKCKVIFRDKASKQIDSGEIKLFNILLGTISNQGQKVLMAFQAFRVWEHPRIVGVVRSWRFQTVNIYLNGSNYINWNQKSTDAPNNNTELPQQDVLSVDTRTASQRNLKASNSKDLKQLQKSQKYLPVKKTQSNEEIRPKQSGFSFGSDQFQIISNHNSKSNSILTNLTQTQSIKKDYKIEPVKSQRYKFRKELLIAPQTQSQQSNEKQKIKTPLSQKIQKRIQKINQRLSQELIATQLKSEKNHNEVHQQALQIINNDSKQRAVNCLEDQFDFELFSQFQIQPNKIKSQLMNLMLQQSAKEIYSTFQKQLKSERKTTFMSLFQDEQLQNNGKPQRVNSNHKKQILLQYLLQSEDQVSDKKQTITKRLSSYKKVIFVQQQYGIKNENQSKKSNKQYNISAKSGNNSQISEVLRVQNLIVTRGKLVTQINNDITIQIIVLCTKIMGQDNVLHVVQQYISNQQGQVFNLILPFQLQENLVYSFKLCYFDVKQPTIQQFNIQVELKSNTSQIEGQHVQINLEDMQRQTQHKSYVSIQKIESMRQGVSFNIVGVVSRNKNIVTKKGGWVNIFTILDPFSGVQIDFTIFDKIKIIIEPGSPIVVFNVQAKSYQNKLNLISNNYTCFCFGKDIVYYKFANIIPQANKIRKWEEEGNTINNVVSKVNTYNLLSNLMQAQQIAKSQQLDSESYNVETPVCRISKISPFFIRLICDSCNKKMNGGSLYCYKCGKREKPIKQLQLTILISDHSSSMYIQFSHFDSLALIGFQGKNFHDFSTQFTHQRAKFWLILNPKYKAQVIKMKKIQSSQFMANQLLKLRQQIKYI